MCEACTPIVKVQFYANKYSHIYRLIANWIRTQLVSARQRINVTILIRADSLFTGPNWYRVVPFINSLLWLYRQIRWRMQIAKCGRRSSVSSSHYMQDCRCICGLLNFRKATFQIKSFCFRPMLLKFVEHRRCRRSTMWQMWGSCTALLDTRIHYLSTNRFI